MSRYSFIALLALFAVAQATPFHGGGAVNSFSRSGVQKQQFRFPSQLAVQKKKFKIFSGVQQKKIPCFKDVVYQVVNECQWSARSHPVDYPSNAHWSPLCGTTHNAQASLFSVGGISTDGVKLVAETGDCSILEDEVQACGAANKCASFLSYPCNPFSGTCTHSGTVKVTRAYPYISLVSMIAPSPDWFVGVDSFPLCKNGFWVPEYEKYLMALDSGTDAGVTFLSPDAAILERLPISVFDAKDQTNIFYNPQERVLNPLCKIRISLAA